MKMTQLKASLHARVILMFLPIPSYHLTPALSQGNPLASLTKPPACLMWQMPRGICNRLLNPFSRSVLCTVSQNYNTFRFALAAVEKQEQNHRH